MDARTREALEASIKHWEANVAAEKPEDFHYGPDHCALCREFRDDGCYGCPVRKKTGEGCCFNTPYGIAERAGKQWIAGVAGREACILPAQAELDFLRSLLPAEEA
jgi:hypothetical protein